MARVFFSTKYWVSLVQRFSKHFADNYQNIRIITKRYEIYKLKDAGYSQIIEMANSTLHTAKDAQFTCGYFNGRFEL